MGNFGIDGFEAEVEQGARQQACYGVDGVVGHDVDGGEAHQDVEGQYSEAERATACVKCQKHDDGGDAYMAAGEGCRGVLASIVNHFEQMVYEAACPSWRGHSLGVGEEPVAHVGEDARCYLVGAYCFVVVLWASDWHEVEDDVVDVEGCQQDEGCHEELLVALDDVVDEQDGHEREVADVAHAHEFGEPSPGYFLREE